MIIIGRKDKLEAEKVIVNLRRKDRIDRIRRTIVLILVGIIHGLIFDTLIVTLFSDNKWIFVDRLGWLALESFIVFFFWWLCGHHVHKYEVEDLPLPYRYHYLTSEYKVLKEDVRIVREGCAGLFITTEADDGNIREHYFCVCDIELKPDIKETVVDLENEVCYMPLNQEAEHPAQ